MNTQATAADNNAAIPDEVWAVFDKSFTSKAAAAAAAKKVQHLCPLKIGAHDGCILGWLVRFTEVRM